MTKPSEMVGASPKWQQIHDEVRLAGPTDAKVLITGESGVGKEVVAHLIHKNSRRADGRLVTLNCAGVPESLLESELFGHMRGSFTDAHRDKRGLLEQADGGTIFMDEIGEMSLRMQALLLRFLETGEIQPVGAHGPVKRVDTRLIAATNRDLLAQVAQGEFREDLYYRINVMHIPVPPLRERAEDIRRCSMPSSRASPRSTRPTPMLSATPESCSGVPLAGQRAATEECRRASRAARLPPDRSRSLICRVKSPRTRSRRGADGGVVSAGRPDRFERLLQGESFWTAVHEPFMSRDMTREELRQIVRRGLTRTHGSTVN